MRQGFSRAVLTPIMLLATVEVSVASAGWTHEITTDPVTKIVTCTVQIHPQTVPFPWFLVHGDGSAAVAVVGDMSIGEPQSFRVDAHDPVSESDRLTGPRAKRLISEVRAGGKTLSADFVLFPSSRHQTLTVDLAGIKEHLDACLAATH